MFFPRDRSGHQLLSGQRMARLVFWEVLVLDLFLRRKPLEAETRAALWIQKPPEKVRLTPQIIRRYLDPWGLYVNLYVCI